jgi:magnesium and cobalt transporter
VSSAAGVGVGGLLVHPSGYSSCSLTAGTANVSDPASSRAPRRAPLADRRSFFDRLLELISPGPDSKDELIRTLADAESRELIEPESRLMLEGVLRMADMTAGDVMVPATRMDLLDIEADYDELLASVIDTGHSRFPAFDGSRDNVIGILMAKDLLKLQRAPELNLRTLLRPAVFVPESKRLNELLRDFRSNRNHLAMVIDEFGNTAGLITIEDVLEEIVGEIEDEFDEQEQENGIYTLADGSHRVAGDVSISAVNEAFGEQLPEDGFDTIGGLVAQHHGRVPRRGEAVFLGGLRLTVMITRGGAVRWFRVARKQPGENSSSGNSAANSAPSANARTTTADGGDVD